MLLFYFISSYSLFFFSAYAGAFAHDSILTPHSSLLTPQITSPSSFVLPPSSKLPPRPLGRGLGGEAPFRLLPQCIHFLQRHFR